MDHWKNRVVLVTGASVGIGAIIARDLVKHGMKVIACARSLDKIQNLAEELKEEAGTLHPVQCDLTQESQILEMFEMIKKEFGVVDVLINNAGLAHSAPIFSGETEQWRNMLEVNVLAPCICAREAFQLMKANKVDDGHIININSVSGQHVYQYPDTHFYSATKFALRALNEGMRNEMRAKKTHMRVCEISPGLVKTEFLGKMQGEEKAEQIYNSFKALEPQDVSDAVIYALSAPPHVQVHEMVIWPTEQGGTLD